jgi:DNA gyrase subunit A
MVSQSGMLIRMTVEEISQIGRATQGVRLIRLDDDDRVVAVAKLEEREEPGDDEPDDAPGDEPEEARPRKAADDESPEEPLDDPEHGPEQPTDEDD